MYKSSGCTHVVKRVRLEEREDRLNQTDIFFGVGNSLHELVNALLKIGGGRSVRSNCSPNFLKRSVACT